MVEPYDIYVELDALQDTRWGSLMRQAPEQARKLIMDIRYYQRDSDDFEALVGIDKPTTDAFYAKRDTETLAASVMTGMVLQLRQIARSLYRQAFTNPTMQRVKVELNIWPYELTDHERATLAEVIRTYIGADIPVILINLPPEEITPRRIRAQYSGMIMYNFNQWLVHHTKEMERVMFPRVTIMAPRLFVDKPPADPSEISFNDPNLNPWTLARYGYAPFFTLMFMPVSQYCIIPPPVLKDILAEGPEDPSADTVQSSSSSATG